MVYSDGINLSGYTIADLAKQSLTGHDGNYEINSLICVQKTLK